ncbi:MAG: hypothetical protein ACREPT_04525 [Rudaea sp.]
MPIDLLVYLVNSLMPIGATVIDESDNYFCNPGTHWNDGLKQAFASISPPAWSLPPAQSWAG